MSAPARDQRHERATSGAGQAVTATSVGQVFGRCLESKRLSRLAPFSAMPPRSSWLKSLTLIDTVERG